MDGLTCMDGPTEIAPDEPFSLHIDLSQISQDRLRASLAYMYAIESGGDIWLFRPTDWLVWDDDKLFANLSGEVSVTNVSFLPAARKRTFKLEFDVWGAETGFVA